jgi:hypothetical protein
MPAAPIVPTTTQWYCARCPDVTLPSEIPRLRVERGGCTLEASHFQGVPTVLQLAHYLRVDRHFR